MATQISPQKYFSNMAKNDSNVPLVSQPTLPQTTPTYQRMLLEDIQPIASSESHLDYLIVFGITAVVGMVALCFIAYQRGKQ